MKATVVISVYKNVKALSLILESLRVQTCKDFDIIISEDGEDAAMRQFVEQYDWFCRYKHLTQTDDGWRKNRALNRAVLAANNQWLIFIDGDCVVHRRFVEMHLRYAEPNKILLGKRVKLSSDISTQLLDSTLSVSDLPALMWRLLFFNRGCRYVDEGLFIPYFLSFSLRSTRSLTGCNMSFSREAIMSINGFDEDYVRPAIGEDVDIYWRLKANGYEPISIRNRAIAYHLYHKENWTEQEENKAKMELNIKKNQIVCLNGISNHLPII